MANPSTQRASASGSGCRTSTTNTANKENLGTHNLAPRQAQPKKAPTSVLFIYTPPPLTSWQPPLTNPRLRIASTTMKTTKMMLIAALPRTLRATTRTCKMTTRMTKTTEVRVLSVAVRAVSARNRLSRPREAPANVCPKNSPNLASKSLSRTR
ncbi:hypothetical protein B0H19DRAFT_281783 [Mycena capillaripes]|nr:hypothetical protein B0H19DRAFT_281783 [Mycena capillaripes]